MDKLSREEVLHIAELGKLKLSSNEIDKFSYQLKALLDTINKVNEIDLDNDEIMISPSDNKCCLFSDCGVNFSHPEELVNNAPKRFDGFVEVRGVFDE